MVAFDANWSRQNTMQMEEISTWVQAAKDDPAAFGRLYSHYVQPIYKYLYSRVGTVHDAEDLTSQTFMTAYESLARYRERGYFSAWLFRIARSKLIDHFRRNKREVGLDAVGEMLEREDSLGVLIRAEELSKMRFLIHKLSEDQQELLRLRYVADLSFAEMAELLGEREDTVKKSVYRLLIRLKGQME